MFQSLIAKTISLMTVFLFGSTGEIITEKSGHLNMGIPGIMCLGGLGGLLGECIYINNIDISTINPFLCIFIPIIFTLIFGALGGLIFSFFAVSLRCNQNVVGLLLTTFGAGITSLFITSSKSTGIWCFTNLTKAGTYFKSMFFPGQVLSELNPFVYMFLSHGILTYMAIILAVVSGIVLSKTYLGLSIRSIGENPACADAQGLNVTKYRYFCTIIGAAVASLGGLFLIMDNCGGADPAGISIESYGWLAVALVIFSMWKPAISIAGSFIFSIFYTLPNLIVTADGPTTEFLKMIPYLMTLIVLILTSVFKIKGSNAPKALGISYFREDR